VIIYTNFPTLHPTGLFSGALIRRNQFLAEVEHLFSKDIRVCFKAVSSYN